MNGRFIFMVIIALVFAGVAALIARSWINSKVNKDVVTSSVVVAATDIPFGVKLEPLHIKTVAWPSKDVPQGSYAKVEDVIGKIVKNSFYAGELITQKRITEHLGGSTLSSLISQNSRAISIRVNDVVGVSGFVLPNNRVDILATQMKREGGEQQAKTRTILENIKVLAVDQEASPDKEKPAVVRAVTLELDPPDAEKMVEAMQEGTIQLTLRNPLDSNKLVGETPPVTQPVSVDKPAHPQVKPSVVMIPWSNPRAFFSLNSPDDNTIINRD
jgi:pilus assembly protein CpaB